MTNDVIFTVRVSGSISYTREICESLTEEGVHFHVPTKTRSSEGKSGCYPKQGFGTLGKQEQLSVLPLFLPVFLIIVAAVAIDIIHSGKGKTNQRPVPMII